MSVEFRAWPKIPRGNSLKVTITEKIDGTNGCIIIEGGEIVGVQSRKRLITPEDDNYGFAAWVGGNWEGLLRLGDGYHYGEWAGLGIQGNPRRMPGKHFFLFNTFRWNGSNPNLPRCCSVVPTLFTGELLPETVSDVMAKLWNSRDITNPEGIIIYNHTGRSYTKVTFANSLGKWKS